jgi:hypothetical protein
MPIIKGLFMGVWLFSFGTIGYFLLKGFIPRAETAFDIRTVYFMTVSNPSWWLALVASLCVGVIIARGWHIGTAVWAGLIVTELFPVALLTVILVLAGKLREVSGR